PVMGKKREKRSETRPAPPRPAATAKPTPPRWALFALAGMVVAAGGAFLYARFHPFGAARAVSGSLKGANVLLVTLDTTRADHLPAYGYKGVKTPGLDRIAESSLVFDDAI